MQPEGLLCLPEVRERNGKKSETEGLALLAFVS